MAATATWKIENLLKHRKWLADPHEILQASECLTTTIMQKKVKTAAFEDSRWPPSWASTFGFNSQTNWLSFIKFVNKRQQQSQSRKSDQTCHIKKFKMAAADMVIVHYYFIKNHNALLFHNCVSKHPTVCLGQKWYRNHQI
jgi:hypothetical protein